MVRPEIIERRDEIAKTPILERIAAMKETLAAAGDEAQQLRHLPAWASKEMADQGLYRFVLPVELGGDAQDVGLDLLNLFIQAFHLFPGKVLG